MTWLSSCTAEEKKEYFEDSADAFKSGVINEKEFRWAMVMLGYNATDIEDNVSFYRPEPPENADGDAD